MNEHTFLALLVVAPTLGAAFAILYAIHDYHDSRRRRAAAVQRRGERERLRQRVLKGRY